MAKKNNPESNGTGNEAKAPIIIDASRFTKNAQKVLDITDKWNGTGPNDLQEGLKSTDLEKFNLSDLEGREITILGYQDRTGTIKNKDTEYVLILMVPEGSTQPAIIMTGATVIVKKLHKTLESASFPIIGRVKECQGADFNYFDLVS